VFSASLSPADNLVVAFAGTGSTHWFTTDGGESYTHRSYDWSLKKGGVKWHPTDRSKGLGYKEDPHCLEQRAMRCYGELMLTEDGGLSWRALAEHIKYLPFGQRPR
jgi:hypothetical protein